MKKNNVENIELDHFGLPKQTAGGRQDPDPHLTVDRVVMRIPPISEYACLMNVRFYDKTGELSQTVSDGKVYLTLSSGKTVVITPSAEDSYSAAYVPINAFSDMTKYWCSVKTSVQHKSFQMLLSQPIQLGVDITKMVFAYSPATTSILGTYIFESYNGSQLVGAKSLVADGARFQTMEF